MLSVIDGFKMDDELLWNLKAHPVLVIWRPADYIATGCKSNTPWSLLSAQKNLSSCTNYIWNYDTD